MKHTFDDHDRPSLAQLLTQLAVGDQVHILTLPFHGTRKAYQRLYEATARVSHPYHFQITADRKNGGVTCERIS